MNGLVNRLKTLENRRSQPVKNVREMTDAELRAILGPEFAEREPIDEELLAIIKGEQSDAT